MAKKIIGISLFIEAILISLYCLEIEQLLVSSTTMGWTISSLLPKGLVIVFSILGSIVLFSNVKSNTIKIAVTVLPFICFGIAFYSSPIYEGDYSKKGTENVIVSDDNWVMTAIEKDKSADDGLVCVLSASCGHCVTAAKRVKVMHKRQPKLAISIVLFGNDSTEISDFKALINEPDFIYHETFDFKNVVDINLGGFPCFIYLKDHKIIQRWHDEQMGYPTFDWIENGLED